MARRNRAAKGELRVDGVLDIFMALIILILIEILYVEE
jgi:hypothetical protein